jgi:pentapeptide MXKDX repeat protein
MNRKLMMLPASCVLASSTSIFAQDAAKQDGMQNEETKQNEMKQDSMGKDEMKQDSMGHDSTIR